MTRQVYFRGDVWMVDFGNPIGHEQGNERPAIIVSDRALVETAHVHGVLIGVPGTRTPQVVPRTGQVRSTCIAICPSPRNGLSDPSYFLAEQVRAVSVARFRRRIGSLEPDLLRSLEDRLCLVMGLYLPE